MLLLSGILSLLLSSLLLGMKLAVELFLDSSKSDGGAIELKLASSSLAFLSTQRLKARRLDKPLVGMTLAMRVDLLQNHKYTKLRALSEAVAHLFLWTHDP